MSTGKRAEKMAWLFGRQVACSISVQRAQKRRQAQCRVPAAVLFSAFAEIHPFRERALALPIAFVEVQIVVWIIQFTHLLHLLMKIGFNCAADLF